jgi:hypothetical protein
MSKHNQIREHLLSGEPITGLTALELYGVYRLSSVINRLRNKDSLPIKTVMVETRDGQTVFAKYFIPISERGKIGN